MTDLKARLHVAHGGGVSRQVDVQHSIDAAEPPDSFRLGLLPWHGRLHLAISYLPQKIRALAELVFPELDSEYLATWDMDRVPYGTLESAAIFVEEDDRTAVVAGADNESVYVLEIALDFKAEEVVSHAARFVALSLQTFDEQIDQVLAALR